MDLSAHEASDTRFRGTRYAYDRLEVDRFHERVVASLEAYETALAGAEERIVSLEKSQAPGFRRGPQPAKVTRAESEFRPDAADDQSIDTFNRWRAEREAVTELEELLAAAREEARMVRALATEQAADEIAALTSEAREEALAVTQRAAQLATETEEAARRRADEIVEAAVPTPTDTGRDAAPTGGGADMDEINQRIVRLRSSIAAVQNRLESLVTTEDDETGADVIELDLRDESTSPPTKPKRKRKRAAAAATKAAGTTPTAAEVEERMAQLRERLGAD